VTPEKVRLGRWLFFDKRLSGDGSTACASCHHPENAFSELTPHSTGVAGRQGERKSQSLVNIGWPTLASYLWDGRAYDRFASGDQSALIAQAKLGQDLFFGKARCSQCHTGGNFTDSQFHNLGIGWNPQRGNGKVGFTDLGRGKITDRDEDTGAFKTPTLWDAAKHPPYMHDGSLATLREVVEHYRRGGASNPWLSDRLSPIDLTSTEIDALVAFLKALDGEGYEERPPVAFPN
jgi:cytochrome c peroxidase